MTELGTILQLTWRVPYEARKAETDEHGEPAERLIRVVFSQGGTFAVELIEGKEAAFGFDHVGYWVSDWVAERARLESEGIACFVAHNANADRHALYAKGSFGMLFEACSIREDRPQLHDLYPSGAPLSDD
jgi:hypothetical protein